MSRLFKIINLAWTCTLRCNLRCTHCYAVIPNAKVTDGLSGEVVKTRIIEPLARMGARFISFTGGEPLLRSDLFDLMEYAKSRGLHTSLVTNGLLLQQHEARLTTNLVDGLQVSLESHREEVNDSVRGRGVYRQLVRDVFPWLKNHGFRYSIAVTPTPINENDLEGLAELAYQMGATALTVRRFLALGNASSCDESLFSDPARQRAFLERVLNLRRRYQGRLNVRSSVPLFSRVVPEITQYRDAQVLGGCTAGIASCAVGLDGTIKICTRVDYSLGNVQTHDVQDVWESHPALMALRNRDRLHGKCGICKERWICGGCRGVAFKQSGDILGEDTQCWST